MIHAKLTQIPHVFLNTPTWKAAVLQLMPNISTYLYVFSDTELRNKQGHREDNFHSLNMQTHIHFQERFHRIQLRY